MADPGDLVLFENKLYRVLDIDFDYIEGVKLLKVVKAYSKFNILFVKTIIID